MIKCIDEGTLQAWFDDELDANTAANVAAHLHACIHCAEAAQTLEVENLIVSQGLSAEFGEAVPTERLRQRVEAAVAKLNVTTVPATNRSLVNVVRNFFPSFRVVAYASIAAAMLIAGVFLVVNLRTERPAPSAGNVNPKQVVAPGSPAPSPQSPEPQREVVAVEPSKTPAPPRPKAFRKRRASEPDAMSLAWLESQYQKAFPKLNEAIKAQAPLSEVMQYQSQLKSVTGGQGSFAMELSHYEPVPPQVQANIVAQYKPKAEEE